jgi:DNA helicase-2/ATP-dependent DNA helicase PcrA
MITKVFGPPGSGKTTYLLDAVEKELQQDVPSLDIGYFAFTRKAAHEARDRAIKKFPHLSADIDFPWFRTLHSLAYFCLGVESKDMLTPQDYAEFAKSVGLEVNTSTDGEEFVVRADNAIMNEINIARIRGTDLHTHYNQSALDIEWFHFEYIERSYRKFKEAKMLMDFTDLLEQIVQQPERLPTLRALIIDEAQDLSLLQWKLVMCLSERSEKTIIGGDDDQAVYVWAGADVESFLGCEGETKILNQSYRVPSKVHFLADKIVQRIQKRQPKAWAPRTEGGEISYYNDYQQVDISKGEWLIMASTNYMLNDLHHWIKSQGLLFERHGHKSVSDTILTAVVGWERLRAGQEVNFSVLKPIYKYLGVGMVKRGHRGLKKADPEGLFSMDELKENHGLETDAIWHEALGKIGEDKRDYLVAVLRRGTKLSAKASIQLSTIHGAKGGEADNVLLLTDLSPKFAKEYSRNADSLNRLLYVGVTRTRQSLHIVRPQKEERGFRF